MKGVNQPATDVRTNSENPTAPALLEDPPQWLSKQLELFRNDPDRYIKPTCSAVAQEVYGTATRWKEVKPHVEQWLGEDHNR